MDKMKWTNYGQIKMNTSNLMNREDVERFLRKLGLTVGEPVVRKVVSVLRGGEPGCTLYKLFTTREGRPAICGKGTAYKVKKLYDAGELNKYLAYLNLEAPFTLEQKQGLDAKGERDLAKALKPEKQAPIEREENDASKGKLLESAKHQRLAFLQRWREQLQYQSLTECLSFYLHGLPHDVLRQFAESEEVAQNYSNAEGHHMNAFANATD